MMTNLNIRSANADDAENLALMVEALLGEIMDGIGSPVFNFNGDDTRLRLRQFLDQGNFIVFIAEQRNAEAIGFIALTESHALYAEGAFGIIPEFFVRPNFRSQQVGLRLLEQAKAYGHSRGWKRLEVTTPPLPQFDKTLAFYQREGFAVTGGRKLKALL